MKQPLSNQGRKTTEQTALAQFALLDDLHRFGVTTSLSEQANGIFRDFTPVGSFHQHNTNQFNSEGALHKEPKPSPEPQTTDDAQNIPPQQTPPQKTPQKEVAKEATSSPRRNFSPEKYILFEQGSLPLTVLMTLEEGGVQPLSFADEQEKTLWFAMMRATGVTPVNTDNKETEQAPSYMMVVGDAALDGNLREAEEALLQQAVARKLSLNDPTPKAVLAVGGRAHRLLSPAKGRGSAEQISLKKDCPLPLLTIYQLQAMLRQPALKRQTWATLLELKKVL